MPKLLELLDLRAYERFEWLAEHFGESAPGRAASVELRRYHEDETFVEELEAHRRERQARSLLSLGNSYAEAGREESAAERYREVIEQYPESDAAAQAEAALKALE